MSSSVTTHTNGVVVITHVHPIGNGVGFTGGTSPHCLGQVVSSVMDTFRRGNPKALGTVQIMIGLMTLMLGIVMASSTPDSVGVYSGIFVWGSVVYVIAGSLTVAADNHLNKCLVNGSLGLNIVATVFSMTAIIIYSLDTAGLMFYCHHPYDNCQQYLTRSRGISGVLTVLSLLEFIVSIYVSVIAGNAVCQCCQSDQEQVFLVGNQLPVPDFGIMNPGNTAFPPLNHHQVMNCPGEPVGGAMGTGFQQNIPPPQYTAAPS
ncbi:hypothetical protein UPYG_G00096350 [Umbra pygmaea]|uniref:Membrane-spanning 4-domains subfamily A member 4A-like n=1 Tax=Umbra pygmaea TaxID=75934 RepID=A0ABD0XHV5_UMBPY